MTVQKLLSNLSETEKSIFTILDQLIRKYDQSINAEIGSIMSVKRALIYKQEGVFKYGLTATKNHFSYHSMIMYAYPDILIGLMDKSKNIRFQKGCFNFKEIEDIDMSLFEKFLEESASKDFSPILKNYKNRK